MKQIIIIGALLCTGCVGLASAQQPAKNFEDRPWLQKEKIQPFVSPTEKEQVLGQLEAYFNRITTMESNFVQVAPDGTLSEGKFYLSRPGKVRWEYNPPASVVIVGKSGLVTYYDKALDQISHAPIGSTPVNFLTRAKISFKDRDLEVKELRQTSAGYELLLTQTGKEVEGTVLLTFSKKPLELKKIEVIDAAEQHTLVSFTNSVFGGHIPGDKFIIEDPRLFRKR